MKKYVLIIISSLLILTACSTKKVEKDKTDVLEIALQSMYDEYYNYECTDGTYKINYINQSNNSNYTEEYKEGSNITFGIKKVDDITYLQILAINDEISLSKQINLTAIGNNIQITVDDHNFNLTIDHQEYYSITYSKKIN